MASGDKIGMALCIIKPLNDVRQEFSMPTGNTSPILPPSSIFAVWLCGKSRQLNKCTNMYVPSFLCVHVVCACSTMNYATPP